MLGEHCLARCSGLGFFLFPDKEVRFLVFYFDGMAWKQSRVRLPPGSMRFSGDWMDLRKAHLRSILGDQNKSFMGQGTSGNLLLDFAYPVSGPSSLSYHQSRVSTNLQEFYCLLDIDHLVFCSASAQWGHAGILFKFFPSVGGQTNKAACSFIFSLRGRMRVLFGKLYRWPGSIQTKYIRISRNMARVPKFYNTPLAARKPWIQSLKQRFLALMDKQAEVGKVRVSRGRNTLLHISSHLGPGVF